MKAQDKMQQDHCQHCLALKAVVQLGLLLDWAGTEVWFFKLRCPERTFLNWAGAQVWCGNHATARNQQKNDCD